MSVRKEEQRAAMCQLAKKVESLRTDILFSDGEEMDCLADHSEATALALQAIAQLEVAQRTFTLAAFAVDRGQDYDPRS